MDTNDEYLTNPGDLLQWTSAVCDASRRIRKRNASLRREMHLLILEAHRTQELLLEARDRAGR